jgi:hypothetical protein
LPGGKRPLHHPRPAHVGVIPGLSQVSSYAVPSPSAHRR